MVLRLGINLGFAINKFIEPKEWTRIVAEDLKLKYVQFVADLLNPFLPKEYIEKQIKEIQAYTWEYGITIESVFTSTFTRVNHLMNPDEEARKIWLQWFKDFFIIASRIGAKSGGSHFGILTFADYNNPSRREFLIEEGVKGWQELSHFVKELGFECLIFEPMSVERELGNTVEDSLYLMNRVNENCGVPMRICLDTGHAPHPDQRDPYPWIEKLGAYSPIIHIQQTELNKSNHAPFTKENNKKGIIHPEKVLKALEKSGAKEASIVFEISHREHRDSEHCIIPDLIESVEYWRPYIKD